MSALFNAEEILLATKGQLKYSPANDNKGRTVWELEDLTEGDWFIAIPSHYQDPHDNLHLALEKGARGLIVNRRGRYASAPSDVPIITVPDTRVALLDLMRAWRYRVQPRVVGVTGTSGRRATMIVLHQLLQNHFKTHVAFMNNLGWYGCAKEVFSMPEETEVLIFEAGAVERGDITRVGGALDPDLAVLTQIRHPLPSPERDALTASLYCELLETLNLNDGQKDQVSAVIYDDSAAVEKRAAEVLQELVFQKYSQCGKGLVHRVPEEFLKSFSYAMESTVGLPVTRADLWCAVEAARALGLSQETLEKLLELEVESKAV